MPLHTRAPKGYSSEYHRYNQVARGRPRRLARAKLRKTGWSLCASLVNIGFVWMDRFRSGSYIDIRRQQAHSKGTLT